MRQVVVYIHGLVPIEPKPHLDEYQAMHEGLRSAGIDLPAFSSPDVVKVELWWDSGIEAAETANLAAAQNAIADALGAEIPPRDRLTAPLMRDIRETLQFAWADAFFYTSEDGEERTRNDVWSQVLGEITQDDDVDLTFICHSGGTLVAHDFLFYLFSGKRDDKRKDYADAATWAAAEERWRIRTLVTMGSPLAPLMVRSSWLVDKFASDSYFRLDPDLIGLGKSPHAGGQGRWLNVWDIHDILSFPVSGLYGDDDRVRDLSPDVGDWPGSVHNRYWTSVRAHRLLAEHWN